MMRFLSLLIFLLVSVPVLAKNNFIEICEAHKSSNLKSESTYDQISWLKILFKTANCSDIANKISHTKSLAELIPSYIRISSTMSVRLFRPIELIGPFLNFEEFKEDWDLYVGSFKNLNIFREFNNLKHVYYEQHPNEGRSICETLEQVPSIESLTLRAWELKDEEIKCIKEKKTKIFILGNMLPNETTNKLKNQIYGITNFLGDIETIYQYRRLQYLGLEDYTGKASLRVLTVLSNLTHLHINIKNNINIQDISNLKSILFLSLNCFNIKSEAPLKVEDRKCKSNAIKDVTFLKSLSWLKGLDLSWNEIEDISPLRSLTQLQFLNLKENKINNINELRHSKELKYLNLASNDLNSIEFIDDLKNLVFLNVSNNNISNIENLSVLTRLKHLSIGNNPIKDIQNFIPPEKLESLNLDARSPARFNLDPTSLSNVILRKSIPVEERYWVEDLLFEDPLKLYLNPSRTTPLSNLENLNFSKFRKLKVLSISGNDLKSIPNLKSLKNLKYLDASSNRFMDPKVLIKVSDSVEYLSLRNNSLNVLSSMGNLKNLRMLDLGHNPLKIEHQINFLNLEILKLDNCDLVGTLDLTKLFLLTSVELQNNRLEGVDVKNLRNLDRMNFSFNEFKEIPNMSSVRHAFSLNLNSNLIKSLKNLSSIRYPYSILNLQNNLIEDLSLFNDSEFKYLAIQVDGNPIDKQNSKLCPHLSENQDIHSFCLN